MKDSTRESPEFGDHEFKERPLTMLVFFLREYHLLVCCWRVNGELYSFSVGVFLEKVEDGRKKQECNYSYREVTIRMEHGF